MTYQTEIQFVHERENNPLSQSILDDSAPRLNKQVIKTLELLSRGFRLTVRSAMDYGIGSLPRRILDIQEKANIRAKRKCMVVNGVKDNFYTYVFNKWQREKAKELLTKNTK